MARRDDTGAAVSEALSRVPKDEVGDKKLYNHARRAEAVSMAIAGLTYEQIGKELDISAQAASSLVRRTIEETRNYAVDDLRQVENARLDRAQAAIWSDVIAGDQKAINTYLRISERRAKMNGLDAPSKVQMAVSVRKEMEQALDSLQQVIDAEIVDENTGQPAKDIAQQEENMAFSQDYLLDPVTEERHSA